MPKNLEVRINSAVERTVDYFKKLAKRGEECKRNGKHLEPHIQSIEYMPVPRACVICGYCNAYYTRPLNKKESREMERVMHTPVY